MRGSIVFVSHSVDKQRSSRVQNLAESTFSAGRQIIDKKMHEWMIGYATHPGVHHHCIGIIEQPSLWLCFLNQLTIMTVQQRRNILETLVIHVDVHAAIFV